MGVHAVAARAQVRDGWLGWQRQRQVDVLVMQCCVLRPLC